MYQNALEGVRVVDFSWVVAGPFCTKLLGLMGADVIKIESATKPQYKNRGSWFSVLNNSKKSCTINLSEDQGKALVKRLVAVSDVVVENFSTGVMDRLGLGYDALRSINANIIYVSSSGVGRTGPGKNYLAYGTLLQGLSGWTSLFSGPNPHMEGMGIVPSWTDHITGLWEAFIIQAALLRKCRTGEGVYVDSSMLESTITVMGDVFLGVAATGKLPVAGRPSSYSSAVPHGIYACKESDSWIAISVELQSEWEGFCRTLGDPSWCHEEGMLTLADRQRNREQIDRRLGEWTSQLPAKEVFHRLQSAGVPAGPCYNIKDVVEDPQMQARGLYRRLPMDDGKEKMTTGIPWRDETEWKGELSKAPALGEHNEYVFLELLGMSKREYESYRSAGIIE
ncbi:MAG: CoA transferase [candidate division NC10 bacterium]